MLINFLNGKSRVFTGEDILEVFTKDLIESLDNSRIKKTTICHTISLMDKDKEVYAIGKYTSHSDFTWVMLIDDIKKTLIVNAKEVLSLNSCNNYDNSLAKCVDSIGEYKVIDANSILNEINALYSEFESKFILENKEVILKKCAELISQGNEHFLNVEESIRSYYIDCFYEDNTPKIPSMLNREGICDYDSSNLDIIYKYVFDKEDFDKEISEKILNKIFQDQSILRQAYNYFSVTEMLLNKIPEADLVLRKTISNAVKDSGKTLNVITMDGKKIKVKSTFISFKYFRTAIGWDDIYVEDIQSIIFGKKVLFER